MVENKRGRPLKFKSREELQKAVDGYFVMCEKDGEPETLTGLALALDTTRETLLDYEKRDEFSDTVKRAKLRIENAYEKRLIARGNGGDIFALKQFGWKDKTEQSINVSGKMSLEGKLREVMGDKF